MNTVTEQAEIITSRVEEVQEYGKMKVYEQVLRQCEEAVMAKIADSWKDFSQNYDKLLKEPVEQVKEVQKAPQKKKDGVKLKVKVSLPSSHKQPAIQTPKSPQAQQKQSETTSFRTRTRSQNDNTTYLKSLKKTNQITNQKEEQQKKVQRLKQIAKRKLQLMQKLKKIDAELLQVKRESSPKPDKPKDDKSLYQSNLNRSFLANLNNSRLNRQASENVVEHHSKAVEMLSKIANEKIKKQQKLTEQFRKKQQAQLMKIQQLEKQRNIELEQKRRRNEFAVSKLLQNNKNVKSKQIHLAKLNEFTQIGQNSTLPMTMISKQSLEKQENKDGLFFQKKSSKNLLTERDFENQEEGHANQFQKVLAQHEQKQEQIPIIEQQQKIPAQPETQLIIE